ncbi:MAG: hypothetical protein HYT28_01525 [Parcubacteria group bacterium]|nr:hypothetical protein [Parcubacteria group bacterium]
MKTNRSSFLSVIFLCAAMIVFTAASNASAITPDEWQELINRLEYFDLIPDGEVAVLNDCGVRTEKYKILFGALHGVRVSGPNMPRFDENLPDKPRIRGNNFVVTLGAGENGYTGPWGYEIFTIPRDDTLFAIILGKMESVRPIWFLRWYPISAKEFKKFCGNYVPYDPLGIGKTWAPDGSGPLTLK